MDEKEGIVAIPKELQKKVKEAGVEKEFNEAIDKLQKGELVGDLMDVTYCSIQLKCGDCGSENIKWVLDRASDEVLFNCKACKNRGWMYKHEYDEAIKNNPDCVIKNV